MPCVIQTSQFYHTVVVRGTGRERSERRGHCFDDQCTVLSAVCGYSRRDL